MSSPLPRSPLALCLWEGCSPLGSCLRGGPVLGAVSGASPPCDALAHRGWAAHAPKLFWRPGNSRVGSRLHVSLLRCDSDRHCGGEGNGGDWPGHSVCGPFSSGLLLRDMGAHGPASGEECALERQGSVPGRQREEPAGLPAHLAPASSAESVSRPSAYLVGVLGQGGGNRRNFDCLACEEWPREG